MNPVIAYLAGIVAWARAKPHDQRGALQITVENLLWIIVVVALVGVVGGVLTGYIQGLLAQITRG